MAMSGRADSAVEALRTVRHFFTPIFPLSAIDIRPNYMNTVQNVHSAVLSYADRTEQTMDVVDRFAFVTPTVVARDLPRIALPRLERILNEQPPEFDSILHHVTVKLQIAFPDPSLLQYDCGKLQKLAELLREKKAGGHR
ncbi:hypothetical protein MPER_15786, partial [Moniliophthora perniciosa FA553]